LARFGGVGDSEPFDRIEIEHFGFGAVVVGAHVEAAVGALVISTGYW